MTLSQLFLMSDEAFLESHWPDRPLWVHGDVSRFGSLAHLDVAALMRSSPPEHACLVYLENDPSWLDDMRMPMRAAQRFLAHGNCVEIPSAHHLLPEAREILCGLNAAMGQATDAGDCSLFCKSHDKGTPPHFDRTEVFVIQVRGRCRWRIAENRAVRNPTWCHYLAEQRSAPEELQMQLRPGESLPVEMPPGSQVVEMTAGTAMFLPRGHLHETLDSNDSVSLTFSTLLPTPAEVLTRLLHRHLLAREEWRQPIVGLYGDEAARAGAQAGLERLSRRLTADVPALLEAIWAGHTDLQAVLASGKRRS